MLGGKSLIYLYNAGDKFVDVTGGWNFNGGSYGYPIDDASCIGGYTEAVRSTSYWNTINSINAKGFNKLVVNFDWAYKMPASSQTQTATFSIYDMLTAQNIASRSLTTSTPRQWISESLTLEVDISQYDNLKVRIGYDGNTALYQCPHTWHMYYMYLKK